jgi:hypothetical protein
MTGFSVGLISKSDSMIGQCLQNLNLNGGDMSSNKSLSIGLIDDGNIVLAQLKAMIAEIGGAEVVATANDVAAAIRVV